MMKALPRFGEMEPKMTELLAEAASVWAKSPDRPRVEETVLAHWDILMDEWMSDLSMPLLVRNSKLRGTCQPHNSGRSLVFTDNAPANWCFATALLGRTPTLAEMKQALNDRSFPIVMVAKKAELDAWEYRCCLAHAKEMNLNNFGWKVCHIRSVGLNDRRSPDEMPIQSLAQACWKLLNPRNMFVVPKIYGGLGELQEFINKMAPTVTEPIIEWPETSILPPEAITKSARNCYEGLYHFLGGQDSLAKSIMLNFNDIERMIGGKLPKSAHIYSAWWSNDKSHSQARSWMSAGWRVQTFDFTQKQVIFVRYG